MDSLVGQASVAELSQGFIEDDSGYRCLGCGSRVEKGVIYPVHGALYDARRHLRHHLETQHGSVFDVLIGLDKSITGLSDVQRLLIERSYRGLSDEQLRDELQVGSTSTIRNHRFSLREKERQARVFLAIMGLLSERKALPTDKTLQKYFADGQKLVRMPTHDKDRRMIVATLAERFDMGRIYTEKQVNTILKAVWHDYSALRRYLVSYGFIERKDDGSAYWRTGSSDTRELQTVDRKTELKRQARAVKPVAGVYQIKNHVNGKVLVESTRNLKTINRQQFELQAGRHRNLSLQQDWNQYGQEAFTFDILETVPEDATDVAQALDSLHQKWATHLR